MPSPAFVRPLAMAEDAVGYALRVPPESAGLRLDWFLRSRLRNMSRTRAQSLIARWVFDVGGGSLRASQRVRAGDWLVLWRPAFEDREPEQPLEVLYLDQHLLVVDKPPLLAVHPTPSHHRNTVLRRLYLDWPGEHLSLIHRLDRETSGVLLLARTREADRAFKRLLEDHSWAVVAHDVATPELPRGLAAAARRGQGSRVEKTYLAITKGIPDQEWIEAPLERDPARPQAMRVARTERGQVARTRVELVARREDYALLACRLTTGRQHQLRVHLASIGCPVVGDRLYGGIDHGHQRLGRHALHAHRYSLPHPFTERMLELESPLPVDLSSFWQSLGDART